jgi:hypothetical protein
MGETRSVSMTNDQATLQRMEALLRANEVRIERAQDKRKITNGQLDARVILRDTPPHWETAKIIDLLMAMPKVGRVKASKWLRMERISATRPLEEFTEHQRARLCRHMDTQSLRRDRLRRQMELVA